jgi:hypothetical protein
MKEPQSFDDAWNCEDPDQRKLINIKNGGQQSNRNSVTWKVEMNQM